MVDWRNRFRAVVNRSVQLWPGAFQKSSRIVLLLIAIIYGHHASSELLACILSFFPAFLSAIH